MTGVDLPIETERLVIRPLVADDAAALHELYADPVALAYLADNLPANVEESAAWIQDKIDLHEQTGLSLWAMTPKATGEVIGDTGLQQLDDGRIEVAAGVIRRHWHHGYGSEAARSLIAVAFSRLPVTEVVGVTDPDNRRARAAMERIGMTRTADGTLDGRRWVVHRAVAGTTGASSRPPGP